MIDKTDIIYTFKKSYHISYNEDYFCCVGTDVNLYYMKDGKPAFTFKNIKNPSCSLFTPNRQLIVKTTLGMYFVYDLNSMTLVKTIPPPEGVLASTTDFQITSDNKYIIDFYYVFPSYKLMIIETETGAYSFFDIEHCRKAYVFSTRSESKYYVIAECAKTAYADGTDNRQFYELSYKSDKFELHKLFAEDGRGILVADYASDKFATINYKNKLKLFDIVRHNEDVFEFHNEGVLYDLKISKNGKYIALAESQNVYVYDIIKKECVKIYNVQYGCFVDFIDNDTKLLIGTWEKGYCIYFRP